MGWQQIDEPCATTLDQWLWAPGASVWTLHTAAINSGRAEGREGRVKSLFSQKRVPLMIFYCTAIMAFPGTGNVGWPMNANIFVLNVNALFYCFMFCTCFAWQVDESPHESISASVLVEEGLLLLPRAIFGSTLWRWVFALRPFLGYLMDETRLNPNWMLKALWGLMKCYVCVTQLWLDAFNERLNDNQVIGIWLCFDSLLWDDV